MNQVLDAVCVTKSLSKNAIFSIAMDRSNATVNEVERPAPMRNVLVQKHIVKMLGKVSQITMDHFVKLMSILSIESERGSIITKEYVFNLRKNLCEYLGVDPKELDSVDQMEYFNVQDQANPNAVLDIVMTALKATKPLYLCDTVGDELPKNGNYQDPIPASSSLEKDYVYHLGQEKTSGAVKLYNISKIAFRMAMFTTHILIFYAKAYDSCETIPSVEVTTRIRELAKEALLLIENQNDIIMGYNLEQNEVQSMPTIHEESEGYECEDREREVIQQIASRWVDYARKLYNAVVFASKLCVKCEASRVENLVPVYI